MNKRIKLMLLAILVLTLCIATVGLSACKDTTDKSKLTVTYDDSHTVYEGDTLDSLKPYLTVKYTDKVGNVSNVTDYALSGTLNKGEATVTVKYQGLTASCKITVTEKGQQAKPTIKVELNGGKLNGEFTVNDDGTLTPPAEPTREGYTFLGWYKDEECTVPWNFERDKVTVEITLYIKWHKIDTSKPTVNANVGDGATSNGNFVVNDDNTLTPPQDPVRGGYAFVGWYKDNGCVNVWNFATDKVTENITLYAKWQPKQYTITLDYNGATGGNTQTTLTVTYDQPIGTLPTPTKTGYTFVGWKHGENTVTSATVWKTADNATFVAQWRTSDDSNPIGYTVTFASNGGSAVGQITGVEHNSKINEPNIPSRIGYTFGGWYKEQEFVELWNFDTDTVTQNVTLYAKWTRINTNKCTVIFDSNGGTAVDSIIDTLKNATIVKPSSPIKEGYVFDCWCKDAELQTEWNFSEDRVTQDITLYARWIALHTVTFETNGGGVIPPATVLHNTAVARPNDPAVEGYVLLAWYKDIPQTEPWDFTTDVVTQDLTLYAQWQEVTAELELTLSSDNRYYSVTGIGTAANPNIVIPTVCNDLPVTDIAGYAFEDCSTIESVFISSSITYIGKNAFSNCGNLKTVYWNAAALKASLYQYSIFENCSKLTTVVIGDNVTTIPAYAFSGCHSLTSVIIPGSITSIGESAFSGCSNLASITIPDNVTSISESAFFGCSSLTSVIIPNSITSIGESAFSGCSNLASITIPDNVTSIGRYAFSNCSKLENITIPFVGASKYGTSNTHFGYIFGADIAWDWDSSTSQNSNSVPSSLKTVVITGRNTIAANAFRNCSNITSITIPDSVTSIVDYAFYGCSNLANINYLGSIESWCSIQGLDNLMYNGYGSTRSKTLSINGEQVTDIVIPSTVTSIPSYAFCSTNITNVTIPNSVTSIGQSAFRSCSSLESITIPFVGASKDGTSNTHFGYIFGADKYYDYNSSEKKDYGNAFYVPSSLKTVVITDGSTIAEDAFYNCSNITSITISNSITSIGNYAFSGCSSLQYNEYDNAYYLGDDTNKYLWLIKAKDKSITSCVVNENTKFIYASAFDDCNSLTSVTIPNGVASIGQYTFSDCDNLASINYLGTIESWCNIQGLEYLMRDGTSSKTFSLNGEPVTELVIPNTVKSIPFHAFYSCSNITSITIPNSVTSIGEYAFYGCCSLESITIPDSVTSIGDCAFSDCSSLTGIIIPESVTSIGRSAFSDCNSLESITIPFVGASKDGTANTHFGYIFGAYKAYDSSSSTSQNSNCVPSSLKTVVITGGSTIAEDAFYNCSNITSVTIPDRVTSIGSYAFSNCSSLTSINYLGTIEFWCAGNIQGLEHLMQYGTSSKTFSLYGVPVTELVIPESVTSIPSWAFAKTSITSVTFEENCQCTSIGNYAFSSCSSLTSVIISNSITSIGSRAFSGCSNLASINYLGTIESWCKIEGLDHLMDCGSYSKTLIIDGKEITGELVIPNTVKEIKTYAFYYCKKITNVTIGNGVTSIGVGAFFGCSSLASITIPNSVTSIESATFQFCTSLENITIPASVTSINSYAFYDCIKLANINYLGTIESWCKIEGLGNLIGDSTDSKTFSLNGVPVTELVIPESVTSIPSWAFAKTSITSVTFEENSQCESIGRYAFYGCSSLTSVTIGNSVTSIDSYAFSYCSSLKTVYYNGTVEDWNKINIDSGNSKLTSATRYYYSESEPALNADGTAYSGNYWHYVDGAVTVWKKEA